VLLAGVAIAISVFTVLYFFFELGTDNGDDPSDLIHADNNPESTNHYITDGDNQSEIKNDIINDLFNYEDPYLSETEPYNYPEQPPALFMSWHSMLAFVYGGYFYVSPGHEAVNKIELPQDIINASGYVDPLGSAYLGFANLLSEDGTFWLWINDFTHDDFDRMISFYDGNNFFSIDPERVEYAPMGGDRQGFFEYLIPLASDVKRFCGNVIIKHDGTYELYREIQNLWAVLWDYNLTIDSDFQSHRAILNIISEWSGMGFEIIAFGRDMDMFAVLDTGTLYYIKSEDITMLVTSIAGGASLDEMGFDIFYDIIDVQVGAESYFLTSSGELWRFLYEEPFKWEYNEDESVWEMVYLNPDEQRQLYTFEKIAENVKAFTASDEYFLMYIDRNNALWVQGMNSHGQLGIGSEILYSNTPIKLMDDVVDIVTSGFSSAAIIFDGSLYVWGVSLNEDASTLELPLLFLSEAIILYPTKIHQFPHLNPE
jgi:hypothetical protein